MVNTNLDNNTVAQILKEWGVVLPQGKENLNADTVRKIFHSSFALYFLAPQYTREMGKFPEDLWFTFRDLMQDINRFLVRRPLKLGRQQPKHSGATGDGFGIRRRRHRPPGEDRLRTQAMHR